MTSSTKQRTAVVVGGGPVGCLAALALLKQGWRVSVYEGRPDPRLPESKAAQAQRSINLAISSRGIAALAAVDAGLAARFMETVIPMRGRMIHDARGRTSSQRYDAHGQSINSIDRALLNEGLLNELSAHESEGLSLHFGHKLSTADFDSKQLVFQTSSGSAVVVQFDLCIGADGSYSNVRRQMMRFVRMNFEQEYIPHEYVELRMSASVSSSGAPAFKMDPNHLHIWPRHSFMLIALPNKDKTFTCTLFAPTSELDRLLPPFSFAARARDSDGSDAPTAAQAQALLAWFRTHFPDALELIGESVLLRDLWRNPRSALVCVKGTPYHYRDRVVLLGDAAHAMTPFFGQGLNCGLEDVRVLANIMAACGVRSGRDEGPGSDSAAKQDHDDQALAHALETYTATRHDDLLAIAQMAADNYTQMRDSVTRPTYLLRKLVDEILYRLTARAVTLGALLPALSTGTFESAPWAWLPLYTMVTFRPDISYATAQRKAAAQARILSAVGWTALAAMVGTVGLAALARTRFRVL